MANPGQKKNQRGAEKPARIRDGPLTEARILGAAEKLFARYGFDAVSIKQLADEANVTIGALYHHFPGKESVYAAATRKAFAAQAPIPKKLLDSNEPPERRLVLMITLFIRSLRTDKNFGLLLTREMLDPRPSTAHMLDSDLFKERLDFFNDLIRQINPRANLDEAVTMMIALIFGLANMKGIYALFPSVQKTLETPEEIAECATNLLLRGLQAAR